MLFKCKEAMEKKNKMRGVKVKDETKTRGERGVRAPGSENPREKKSYPKAVGVGGPQEGQKALKLNSTYIKRSQCNTRVSSSVTLYLQYKCFLKELFCFCFTCVGVLISYVSVYPMHAQCAWRL